MTVRRAPGDVAAALAVAASLVVLGAACSSSPWRFGPAAWQAGTAGPGGHGGNARRGTSGRVERRAPPARGAGGSSGGSRLGRDRRRRRARPAPAAPQGGQPAGGAGGGGPGSAGATGAGCSARTGLLFCDDFEARTGLTGPWTAQINGSGTVTVDTTTGHSGTRSVHVHAGDSDFDTLFALHDATVLPAPNGRFYFRAYLRLGRAMSRGPQQPTSSANRSRAPAATRSASAR